MHKNPNSDFAAQLAGFMAHLLTDVPSQAYWITELCKFDFSGAKGCVQLGFLPRNVAKWVSPLWDIGFFGFTGYVCPEEALKSALEGNGIKVQLVLHGPHFQDIPDKMLSELVVAICSLIGSLQRSTGLWRLEEVLSQYSWPEHLESDFTYGASSIGSSVDAKFLAAFSSAAGKKSTYTPDSEESDPEWGHWNSSHELKNPSIRIAFPTVERVKNAHDGVISSRYVLCMAERTWQRLKPVGILRDAIPYPSDRIGHPMHTKVARRRFQSNKKDGSSSSFGWVYSGSHNFSAAAWGRLIGLPSNPRLHVCNYELGMLFLYPPPDSKGKAEIDPDHCFDDIVLPYVVPAPKYGPTDRPATKQAMREALAVEKAQRGAEKPEREVCSEIMEEEEEEEEEEDEGKADYVAEEKDEEKAYADKLWSQVES
ncbi:hypothetical protein V2J09_007076 [Rumex salicifolius]